MIRERVADNVYVFTSEAYAQVNAGAVIGPEWSVLIDTLALPEESIQIKEFVEHRLCHVGRASHPAPAGYVEASVRIPISLSSAVTSRTRGLR